MNRELSIDEYQARCANTAIYRDSFPGTIQADPILNLWHGVAYCGMKLSGESGELVQHVAKAQRDDGFKFTADRYEAIFGELGDIDWYVSMLCNELGFRRADVMDFNLSKLKSRQERGKLQGSGSDR